MPSTNLTEPEFMIQTCLCMRNWGERRRRKPTGSELRHDSFSVIAGIKSFPPFYSVSMWCTLLLLITNCYSLQLCDARDGTRRVNMSVFRRESEIWRMRWELSKLGVKWKSEEWISLLLMNECKTWFIELQIQLQMHIKLPSNSGVIHN